MKNQFKRQRISYVGDFWLVVLLFFVIQGCGGLSIVDYPIAGENRQALLCHPGGEGPFPAVIHNLGGGLERRGYQGVTARRMETICRALSDDGFVAVLPIRQTGTKEEVSRAVDYVKALPNVDPSRVALMGWSRGARLSFLIGTERSDVKALVLMAIGGTARDMDRIVQRIPLITAPVLLLTEAGEKARRLDFFRRVEQAFRGHGKEVKSIMYTRGGGHRLFNDVNYHWNDVRVFLREKLGKAAPNP